MTVVYLGNIKIYWNVVMLLKSLPFYAFLILILIQLFFKCGMNSLIVGNKSLHSWEVILLSCDVFYISDNDIVADLGPDLQKKILGKILSLA